MKKKLLIIENEAAVLNLLTNLANKHSFDCETESSGETYLEKASHFHPDAILMNLNTSKISGLGIIRNYRRRPEFKKTPIIVYSQINEPMVVQEALTLGANAYFSREEDSTTVFGAIQEYID